MAHDYELEQAEQDLLEKEEQYIEECVDRGEDETAVRQRLEDEKNHDPALGPQLS